MPSTSNWKFLIKLHCHNQVLKPPPYSTLFDKNRVLLTEIFERSLQAGSKKVKTSEHVTVKSEKQSSQYSKLRVVSPLGVVLIEKVFDSTEVGWHSGWTVLQRISSLTSIDSTFYLRYSTFPFYSFLPFFSCKSSQRFLQLVGAVVQTSCGQKPKFRLPNHNSFLPYHFHQSGTVDSTMVKVFGFKLQ